MWNNQKQHKIFPLCPKRGPTYKGKLLIHGTKRRKDKQ